MNDFVAAMPTKPRKEPDESTMPDLANGPMEESSQQKVKPEAVTAPMAVDDTIFSLTEMFRSFMECLKECDNRQDSETVRQDKNFRVLNHHIAQMQLEIGRIRLEAISDKPVPRVTDELCLARLKDTDDIDHYLLTFERLAETYQWSKQDWASYLKPFLTGEARSAFVEMDPVHAQDYDSVKTAILKKYEIRAETFRQRFRNLNTPADESPQELYTRLKDLFCKWVNYDSSTKKDIMETLVLEQYLQVLHPDVKTCVKEGDPATAEEAVSLVEAYIKARKVTGSFCYAGVPSLTRGFASPGQSLADKSLQTASSTASSTSATLSGFGDKFRTPAGSWICGTCLVQNVSSDKKCVFCLEPEPNIETASKVDSKPADATVSLSSLSPFPAGSWDCDTCMVRNKPDVFKCLDCDTDKPETGVKSSMTLLTLPEVSSGLSAASSSSPTTTTTTSTGTGLLGFRDKFMKPEGSWDCDVCIVRNKAQDVKCVACQNPKPGAVAAAGPNPAPASTPAPLLGFGDKFKKPEGSWECGVCCVQNKTNDWKCIACWSAKPSEGLSSFFGIQSNSTNSSSSSSSTGGLKLGSSDITSNATSFKFRGFFSDATSGAIKLGSTSSETATSTSGGLKFGGSQDSSTGLKFGGASGISFGSQAASSENSLSYGAKPIEKGSSNSLFTFSVTQSKVEIDNAPAPFKPVLTTTTSSAAANTIPVFGKPLVVESKLAAPKILMPTFTFEKPKDKKDTSVPFGALLFSVASEAEKSTPSLGFAFGKQDPSKDPPKPLFTIGKPDETTGPLKPSFTFGQSKAAPAFAANRSSLISSSPPSSDVASKLTAILGQGATSFGSTARLSSTTNSPVPAFGAKPNFFPVFGQKPNPAPTFGSAAASTGQGGFQSAFGAESAALSTPAASPAMPAVNAPSSGASNFGQTPAFNTGSTNIFTVTPSAQNSTAGCKIKADQDSKDGA
nr:nuclear pore complex protein Nup153-like isoform X2 [Misgurnus anguillicaudatus]